MEVEIRIDRLNPRKMRSPLGFAKGVVVRKRKDMGIIEVSHVLDDVANLITLKLSHASLRHERFERIRLLLLDCKKANRFGSLDGFIDFNCVLKDYKL
jgi:hypothetical protein